MSAVYSFNWISFILIFSLGLTITIFAINKLDIETIKGAKQYLDKEAEYYKQTANVSAGAGFIYLAAVVAFSDSFFGFYDFTASNVLSNNVHVNDRDFYRVTIVLSGFYLMLICVWVLQLNKWIDRRFAAEKSNHQE